MIEETRYGLRVDTRLAFDDAVTATVEALKTEGFGVLTTIDLAQALKEKVGREMPRYLILGACNPPLADRAVQAEHEIGLLLPCNVAVYEQESGGQVRVAAMAPLPTIGMIGGGGALQEVAREADSRLRRALGVVERA
ncbi:MAG: DUF302 domain-containing protein [Vicinamibacteraceae bacterium]|nr:DUF302 domain-containing protein [Vicinamibacteraceae bacterium]